jgi:hypothetical protein
MPKAAIDEDGDAVPHKYYVDQRLGHWLNSALDSIAQPSCKQFPPEGKFWLGP